MSSNWKYLNISLTNFSISFANGWETSVFINPKVQFFIAHKAPSWMHHNWAPSLEISVGSLNFSSTILLMVCFCFLDVVVLHTSRYAWIDLVACRPIGWLWAVNFFLSAGHWHSSVAEKDWAQLLFPDLPLSLLSSDLKWQTISLVTTLNQMRSVKAPQEIWKSWWF